MKLAALLILVAIALAGCSGGGSTQVDPSAAEKARENVKQASAGAPPGLPQVK